VGVILESGITGVHHGQQLGIGNAALKHSLRRIAGQNNGAAESAAEHKLILRVRLQTPNAKRQTPNAKPNTQTNPISPPHPGA
jgi:hypothetical protein